MLRVTPCAVFVSICSLMVACPKNDDPADDSSSGDSTTGTPTTGDDTSTGVATSTGASETTATTGGASETGVMVDEDMLCAAYAAHFVDCFPQGTTVGEVEAQCHEDLDSARASSEACFGALAAYFECQSLAACEVFADSCLDEANARINICGG